MGVQANVPATLLARLAVCVAAICALDVVAAAAPLRRFVRYKNTNLKNRPLLDQI